MIRDPRNPDPRFMVMTGSCQHPNMRKTLSLLRLGDVYFVVEGVATWSELFEEFNGHQRYYYEEHTCPTNFIRVAAICKNGDMDHHGLWEHVESVWMMDEYEATDCNDRDEYLQEVFPQLRSNDHA